MTSTTISATSDMTDHDAHYADLLSGIRRTFASATSGKRPLFRTEAGDGLFSVFLDNLPAERQVHTCGACRRFVEGYGGLVCIGDDGLTVPALWDEAQVPEFYRPAVAALRKAVRGARVDTIHLDKATTWGTWQTGVWSHMAVLAPAVFRHALLTPGQAMAAKREDFKTVSRALTDFDAAGLQEALRILRAGSLHRSERFIGPVQWLLDLQEARKGPGRSNAVWAAIATAPEGYCHPRASVVGSLLEDIAAGMSFDQVKARFDAKVAPLSYQRPQAAPSIGNLAQAEKVVEAMGISRSLERRFARLDEMQTIWTPQAVAAKPTSGVFAHLAPKAGIPASLPTPAVTITWDKFARTVLPGAKRMEALMPHGNAPFICLVTAEHADAPPIIRWDRDEARNPVSWFCYPGGSRPEQWGMKAGAWAAVSAVVPLPTLWGDHPAPHLGAGVALVLAGCVDGRDSGNALFPEVMRDDLRQVRAVIEAYSRLATIGGRDQASACGLDVRAGHAGLNHLVRVHDALGVTEYRLDRWD